MQMRQYDFMKDNGHLSVGQPFGAQEGYIGLPDDLSLAAYRNATGQTGSASDPGYQQWVESRPAFKDFANGGIGIPGAKALPDGMVDIPDKYLASNMQGGSFLGFDNDMWKVMATFGALGAGAAGLSGALGGAGSAASAGLSAAEAGEVAALTGSGTSAGLGAFPTAATGGTVSGITNGFNPFASTPEFQYGNLSGVNPGEFTASQIPGGSLSPYGPAGGGMVDLGGAGGVSGVNLGGVESLLPQLTQQIGKTAAKSVLGKVMNGTATAEDYASIIGKLGATALGVLGSNNQSNQLGDLAAKYDAYGAPSRARYEASMTPGFDPTTIPGYSGAVDTASKAILSGLSTKGNPFGNPGGLIEANKAIISGTALPAVQNYIGSNAAVGFGAPMGAALNLQTQGIGADANSLNAIGYGLNSITNPQPSYLDLIRQMQQGYKPNTGLT